MPEETPGTPPPTDAAPAVVRRAVEVEARPEEVWHAVADPDERALWLDDPDAAARTLRVDEVVAPERLVWTWWRDDDGGDASTVSVVLTPLDDGGTRVEVTEVRLAAPRAPVGAPA
ncbi:MAG: SRPBCC domain-containing protein, partial [Acidimicrobiia bacterium]